MFAAPEATFSHGGVDSDRLVPARSPHARLPHRLSRANTRLNSQWTGHDPKPAKRRNWDTFSKHIVQTVRQRQHLSTGGHALMTNARPAAQTVTPTKRANARASIPDEVSGGLSARLCSTQTFYAAAAPRVNAPCTNKTKHNFGASVHSSICRHCNAHFNRRSA